MLSTSSFNVSFHKFDDIYDHNKYKFKYTLILKCLYFDLQSLKFKFTVFWDVTPCSHAEVDRRFRGVLPPSLAP